MLDKYVQHDIHVEVPRVPYRDLISKRAGTDSRHIREQVEVAAIAYRTDGGKDLMLNDKIPPPVSLAPRLQIPPAPVG